MRGIFRFVKVLVPAMTIAGIICMVAAWFGINIRIFPIFGHSVLLDIFLLYITYTKMGRAYFTDIFRYMIYVLLCLTILETIDTIVDFEVHLYFNILLAVPLIALVLIIIAKIIENDKRAKAIKERTSESDRVHR